MSEFAVKSWVVSPASPLVVQKTWAAAVNKPETVKQFASVALPIMLKLNKTYVFIWLSAPQYNDLHVTVPQDRCVVTFNTGATTVPVKVGFAVGVSMQARSQCRFRQRPRHESYCNFQWWRNLYLLWCGVCWIVLLSYNVVFVWTASSCRNASYNQGTCGVQLSCVCFII